ncbi:MAG: TetR/AcrR family transcriptional regulator [Acidimicrobiales bacterium]
MRDDTQPPPGPVSDTLLDAAMDILATDGWDGLSLEAVARRAGMSRVTAWRQAASKDHLVKELLGRLAADYRDSLWPILTADGSGAQRLEAALEALCDVADRHLPLLLASDTVFHRAHDQAAPSVPFTDPLVRLIRDGVSDHSLDPPEDCETMGLIVFNTVAWPYVHLRGRHGWIPAKARGLLIRLVMSGVRGGPQESG